MPKRPRRVLLPRPSHTLRAYVVTYDAPDVEGAAARVIFARSTPAASRAVETDEEQGGEVLSVRRAREFDRFRRARKVPVEALLDAGWMFVCEGPACGHAPTYCDCEGPYVVRGDCVYCSPACCARDEADHALYRGRRLGATRRIAELFPGVPFDLGECGYPFRTMLTHKPTAQSGPLAAFVTLSMRSYALRPGLPTIALRVELGTGRVHAPDHAAIYALHAWLSAKGLLGTDHPIAVSIAGVFEREGLALFDPRTYEPERIDPPGDTLMDLLDVTGHTPDSLANVSGLDVGTIYRVLNSEQRVDATIAAALSKHLRYSPAFWLHLEAVYRLSLDHRSTTREWITRTPTENRT